MMQEGIQFDKIFVIEGLDNNERKTGQELYEDLLKWKAIQVKGFSAELIRIKSKQDFISAINNVYLEVKSNDCSPIIHLELHGNTNGLGTPSDEFVSWEELYSLIIEINKATNNNLFLTLGVCMGGYLMQEIKISRACPFWGFVGSFETLWNDDILMRYTEFYTELLSSFDLNKSFLRLKAANTGIPADYRFINSEQTFINVYKRYLNSQFTPELQEKRFKDALKEEKVDVKDRNKKTLLRHRFKAILNRTKKEYFEEHRDIFFMIDLHPENKKKYLQTFNPIVE